MSHHDLGELSSASERLIVFHVASYVEGGNGKSPSVAEIRLFLLTPLYEVPEYYFPVV